jgi:hypothetical protein
MTHQLQTHPRPSPPGEFWAATSPRPTMRPMASRPGTKGYAEMPHSLLSIERSEWQTPPYSTALSTSSAPRGPGS